ncbi:MAG: fumarylacetoacetate hydrolase family protein [Candidatus Rokubacteria bacterium]|nr:fumarylacetoacetate hydrolase family protein [Candidatus Rokubacteria bacterium]
MTTWCRIDLGGRPTFGVVEGDTVTLVDGSPFERHRPTATRLPLRDAQLMVPVVPGNFYAVGLNYKSHIEWAASRHGMAVKIPAQADVGYRSPNALIPTRGTIVIPKDSPGPVEYEGELVAVIGRRAKNLSEAEALGCVLGYTLGNDVSERGWQRSDRTLWRAKNADTFKPMGPFIVSGLDPMAQRITVRINGRVVSDYETSAMIFGVAHYLATMSRYLTLYPGDVVWFGCDGPTEPALRPGDVVEVVNDALGVLRNPVAREGS